MTPSGVLEGDGAVPSFVVHGSGVRFEAHTPADRPDLWRAYLDGATQRYRSYGLEWVLDRPSIEDGGSTSLFFVGIDPDGEVVAGLRGSGPLRSAGEARLLDEFATSPCLSVLTHQLDRWMVEGLVELKTGWVAAGSPHRAVLSSVLARCCVYTMELLGARYACGAAAEHSRERWQSTGARILDGLDPVAFPDSRYRSVVVWWDHAELDDHMAPAQAAHLELERRQLLGPQRAG